MTEVRSTSDQGHALYATQEYNSGDIILQESPLINLAPKSYDEIQTLRSQFSSLETPPPSTTNGLTTSSSSSSSSLSAKALKKQKKREKAHAKARAQITASPLHDLTLPSSIPPPQHAKARSMIMALASYALCTDEDVKAKLLSLYAPTPRMDSQDVSSSSPCDAHDHEAPLRQLAWDIVSFLHMEDTSKSIVAPSTALFKMLEKDRSESQKVMLLWACNAFAGGRIYERTSRINHSCDYNAIVSSPSSQADSEAQIVRAVCSIAPEEEIHISYLGSWTYADKHVRKERLKRDKFFECTCARCQREDIEGDIAASIPCIKCHERQGRYLEEEAQYDDEGEVVYAKPFRGKGEDEHNYRCPTSKAEYEIPSDFEVRVAMKKAVEKAILHLDAKVDGDHDQDDDEQWDFLERISSLASSVLGAKHWCEFQAMICLAQTRMRSVL